MSDNLLLKLLQAGLLEALGDDDKRQRRAEAAAVAMGEWLALAGRPFFPSAVVHAIDEAGEPRGPVFEHAEKSLLHEWPALRNAYPESPSELFRAIVLQGVDNAVASDPDLAAAAWYVTGTVRDMSMSAGRWVRVVDDMVGDIDRVVRERLVKEWMPTLDESKMSMAETATGDGEFRKVEFIEGLRADLKPYESNLEGHYQQVSAVLARHVPAILDGFVSALGTDLHALLAQQTKIVEASRLRGMLLWWRFTGRSDLLGMRYRHVEDPAKRALAAAADLHRLCPAVTPEAVEDLLADIVSDSDPPDVSLSFDGLAGAWTELNSSLGLDRVAGPLLGALSLGDQGALPPAMVRNLNPAETAVVAFRDLQATRLTSAVADIESSS